MEDNPDGCKDDNLAKKQDLEEIGFSLYFSSCISEENFSSDDYSSGGENGG
jgi:hypothetical protein